MVVFIEFDSHFHEYERERTRQKEPAVMAAYQMPNHGFGNSTSERGDGVAVCALATTGTAKFFISRKTAQKPPNSVKKCGFAGAGKKPARRGKKNYRFFLSLLSSFLHAPRCRTIVEVLLASYSVVLINVFFFFFSLCVCFLSATASLPARTETAAASFLATADARDRASERCELLRNFLYYLLFLVLYLSRIFS